ncbi:RecT family recombinase [Staphylococcus sp. IVB6214]|uniref:recombinase RecT n=1 Tax=Staphylococcus sp. IVB6214 TaxID=2989766 RepID=UPI0021CE4674|nr:RecT family recombinase [Staphylococcus sp. IVB6214]UXR83200.1 recombinase RecT [Staphylococcus sp. IVB6214]
MTSNQLQKVEQQLLEEKNVSDNVLNKVKVLEAQGNLELPNDYSPSNAMKQAWLQISQDNKLMACNDTSKANALLDMVTQGLNPAKKQCYFIPYGNKMQLQRSYHGNIMMLKRDAGAKDVVAQVIYEGDSFKQELDSVGRVKSIKHEQDFFNISKDKIIGAYCTIVFDDNRENYIEIMTIDQIKQAWLQSSMIKDETALERSKTHNNFKEEMAKKTVINRAAKRYINSSTDEGLLQFAKESEQRQRKEVFDAEVQENANQEILDFQDSDVEDAHFEEVKEVDNFVEVQQEPVQTQQTESEEEPF